MQKRRESARPSRPLPSQLSQRNLAANAQRKFLTQFQVGEPAALQRPAGGHCEMGFARWQLNI